MGNFEDYVTALAKPRIDITVSSIPSKLPIVPWQNGTGGCPDLEATTTWFGRRELVEVFVGWKF